MFDWTSLGGVCAQAGPDYFLRGEQMSGSVSTWIRQVARGESEDIGIANLWSRMWGRLTQIAKGVAGDEQDWQHYDFEDIASTAFNEVIETIKTGQAKPRTRGTFLKALRRRVESNAKSMQKQEAFRRQHHQRAFVELERLAENRRRAAVYQQLREEIEVVRNLCDPESAKILELMSQGYSLNEIAEELNVAPRTIQRRIETIKEVAIQQYGREA